MTLKAQAIKERDKRLGFTKIKKICGLNDTIKKVKETIHRMGKISEKHISNKDLVPGTYKGRVSRNFLNGQRI